MTTSGVDQLARHLAFDCHGAAEGVTEDRSLADVNGIAHRRGCFVALVGPPGAGKGTQASWLTQATGIPSVVAGDLVRSAAVAKSPRGDVITHCVASGSLVPDRLMLQLIRDEVTRVAENERGVLFDGFPRTLAQAIMLETTMLPRPIDIVVELVVPTETITARLESRCRADDTEAALSRRLQSFERDTRPMIERFGAQGVLVRVDGDAPPPVVHRSITEALSRFRPAYRTERRHGSFVEDQEPVWIDRERA